MVLLFIFTILNGCKNNLEEPLQPKESKQASISNITTFEHPGIVNSQKSLELISAASTVLSSFNRNKAYEKQVVTYMSQWTYSSADPTAATVQKYLGNLPSDVTVWVRSGAKIPLSTDAYETENNMRGHAILAYAYALAWVRTNNSIYVNRAKFILKNWA